MEILAIVAFYIAIHFAIYVFWARYLNILQTESGIFLWHFVSFCVIGMLCIGFAIFTQLENKIILLMGVLSLHGIYSISFLELWSLSQGGYSLQILKLATSGLRRDAETITELEKIGSDKFTGRLASLQRLGLLRQNGTQLTLTRLGIIALGMWIKISRKHMQ